MGGDWSHCSSNRSRPRGDSSCERLRGEQAGGEKGNAAEGEASSEADFFPRTARSHWKVLSRAGFRPAGIFKATLSLSTDWTDRPFS